MAAELSACRIPSPGSTWTRTVRPRKRLDGLPDAGDSSPAQSVESPATSLRKMSMGEAAQQPDSVGGGGLPCRTNHVAASR